MVASVSNPADIVNIALSRMGYQKRVGNLFDGSRAANAALDIYSQTRDTKMQEKDWDFAEANIAAVLLKSAPVDYVPPNTWDPVNYPPQPWRYGYQYPADCLKVRYLKGNSFFVAVNVDPQPLLWEVVNDNGTVPTRRMVVSNTQYALMTYTRQVTDPTQWPPDFVDAFVAAISRRLAPFLKDMQAAQMEATDEQIATALAASERG